MNALEYVAQGQIGIRPGNTLRVDDGAGLVVQVWEGSVWMTQEGDARDHYLHTNDWFRLDRDGTTVISALRSPAVVSLIPLAEDRYASRIVLSGVDSKGPIQLHPTGHPELVVRLLATLGLAHALGRAGSGAADAAGSAA
jgi:hypothetical protein